MPTHVLRWGRPSFKPLFSEYLIIPMKWITLSQNACRREVGTLRITNNLAQTTFNRRSEAGTICFKSLGFKKFLAPFNCISSV